jgi:hypothetical protein
MPEEVMGWLWECVAASPRESNLRGVWPPSPRPLSPLPTLVVSSSHSVPPLHVSPASRCNPCPLRCGCGALWPQWQWWVGKGVKLETRLACAGFSLRWRFLTDLPYGLRPVMCVERGTGGSLWGVGPAVGLVLKHEPRSTACLQGERDLKIP